MVLSGCATNYVSQFYRSEINDANSALYDESLMPFSGTTQIYSSSNHDEDGAALFRRGYTLIGKSGFKGSVAVSELQLKQQAKRVGADIVLFGSRYQGAFQAAVPFIQYNPGTSSTTHSSGTANANVYGSSGSAYGTGSYSGTSTTTTPGSYSTTVVPTTVHRYAYSASFWRNSKPLIFGAALAPLPEQIRRELQRNTGALIGVVRDNSPAFRANILDGDILTALDDIQIISLDHVRQVLKELAGQRVVATIIRNGEEKRIEVQLNERTSSPSP